MPHPSAKSRKSNKIQFSFDDLPEIKILNEEIARFKKIMLFNPANTEQQSYRIIAERHLLNGLERARDLLLARQLKR